MKLSVLFLQVVRTLANVGNGYPWLYQVGHIVQSQMPTALFSAGFLDKDKIWETSKCFLFCYCAMTYLNGLWESQLLNQWSSGLIRKYTDVTDNSAVIGRIYYFGQTSA